LLAIEGKHSSFIEEEDLMTKYVMFVACFGSGLMIVMPSLQESGISKAHKM